MTTLLFFTFGWFGSNWWPGIEVDAPKPGGGGDPWWTRWAAGIAAGLGAVVVLGNVPAFAEPLPAIFGSAALGNVVGAIVRPVLSMVVRKG